MLSSFFLSFFLSTSLSLLFLNGLFQPPFKFIFVFSKNAATIFTTNLCEKCHPVYRAGIWSHDLKDMSLPHNHSCSFFLFLFVSTTIKNIIFIFDIGEPKERNQFIAMRSHNSVNKSSSSNNNNNNLDGEVIPGERCLCFRLMAFFEGWGDIFNLDVIMFCLFLFWNLFSSCKENWWKILRLAFCNKWSRKFAFCYERDLM